MRQSSAGFMRRLMADESVRIAIKRWRAEDEVKHFSGRARLPEASQMAHFYKKYINPDLPVQFQPLLRYKEEEDKTGPAAPAADK